VAGTVLSPEGLTVVSDANSNPGRMFGEEGGSETTDVQILMKDGRELPAKFVLRDRDLDLAFVMPTEKGLKLTHVPLEKGPVPDVLDDLVFIHRFGRTLNREAGVALGSVSAVVKKPRTLLVPEASNVSQFLGCPVFDGKGRAIGLVVSRRGGGGGRLSLFGQSVVVPAEDVQQVADQVGKEKDEDK
jgi:S1-C subfamily serine protease